MLGSASEFSHRLLKWYDASRRNLPWRSSADRPGRISAYHVLVSETMLQQTQVATVVPYYHRFLARFPTLRDLAKADEQEVLRIWQGLGYYSRARNLRAAAKAILTEHAGQIPFEVQKLMELPGIGRYTAGAIASIAFNRVAPLLDGNVSRVLCRVDGIRTSPRENRTLKALWARAAELVSHHRPGDFNSALMELGATVCTPRNPHCLLCPVKAQCWAAAKGLQDRIPQPHRAKPTPLVRRYTYCIRRGKRWLIEQRPNKGRWAAMWQFITLNTPEPKLLPVAIKEPKPLGAFTHSLTHRRYEFKVFFAEAAAGQAVIRSASRKWVAGADLNRYPLPRPHLRILEILSAEGKS